MDILITNSQMTFVPFDISFAMSQYLRNNSLCLSQQDFIELGQGFDEQTKVDLNFHLTQVKKARGKVVMSWKCIFMI